MPIAVALPGYNRAAPAEGLAQVLGAGFGAYKNYQEGQVANQELQQKQMETKQKQALIGQMADENSPVSVSARSSALADIGNMSTSDIAKNPDAQAGLSSLKDMIQNGAVVGTDPQTGQPIRKQMNAIDVNNAISSNPFVQSMHEQEKAETQARAMAQAARIRGQSYGDRNSIGVAKDYQDRVQPYRQMQDDIQKLQSILTTKDKNGNPLITKQQIGDANLAILRVFSPNHQSDATMAATEYNSVPAEFAGALQSLSTNPQDTNSRSLVEHIIDQGHHIANVSNQNAIKTLNDLDAGYQNLEDPASRKTAQTTSAQLRKRFSATYPEVGAGSKGPHGNTVKQGNHTYTWNPQTKQYE